MAEPFLRMVQISKRYPGVQALDNVNLDAYPGEALALLGANGAGKSTLMNVLGGVVRPDTGQILIGGAPQEIHSPLAAAQHGIAFVHQEMLMLPTLTVAENLFITSFPTRHGFIDRADMLRRSSQVLARLGCHFTPDTRVQQLSTGDRQMIEIGRALLSDPSIIIFDEPTSSLTSRERDRLFGVIRNLKQDGVTIIYISHFLDEPFTICERVTVLRGGTTVGDGAIGELNHDDIVRMMIGSAEVSELAERRETVTGEPVLQVEGLRRTGVLQDITFTLHRGEILGLWGLLGSGRSEVARSLVGLDPIDGGQIQLAVDGVMRPVIPREAQQWIGMITEDRRNEGLLLPMSVRENMSLANLLQLRNRWRLVDGHRETALAQQFVERLHIKVSSILQPVRTLSGGNQQKVVVGRWLERNPPIYIMDEPTRGLDVGAKAEIRDIVYELAANGAAILVIASEIEEMMAFADRFLVMNRGAIVREFGKDVSKDALMAAAAGATGAAMGKAVSA
ncbi:MAG: sugar ABC transporter ATP-binding protein [Anaerolineales bacterium]|nr:sugar ABC transporter ATP-binding protein [Anaerolineales bacterium]